MKLTRYFDFCESCRLSFNYPLMLVDDFGVLRVAGQPEDKCGTCNKCFECCRCHILMIATDINKTGVEVEFMFQAPVPL